MHGYFGNSALGTGYSCLMPALIASWRTLWAATPGAPAPRHIQRSRAATVVHTADAACCSRLSSLCASVCPFPSPFPSVTAHYARGTSGTTDPVAPFGLVTLAPSGSEGGNDIGTMRWAQTAGYGVVPNPAMPNTFLAQALPQMLTAVTQRLHSGWIAITPSRSGYIAVTR